MLTVDLLIIIDYHSSNISHCTEDETVAVSFPSPLPVGRGLLSLNFIGELNDKLKGFYRCKYTGEDGKEKFCAVTHFEVHFTKIIKNKNTFRDMSYSLVLCGCHPRQEH